MQKIDNFGIYEGENMKIRKASMDDIKKFIEVYKSAYRKLGKYSYKEKSSIKWYFRWLLKRDKNGVFLAEEGEKTIAFIACDANWKSLIENESVGEIHEIIVREECKRRGMGKKLMKIAEEYLRRKGHKKIELWVGKENKEARKFYEKLGYEVKDRYGEWIRMIKKLD